MKRVLAAALACGAALFASAETTYNIYDHVTFYDGYLVENIPEGAPDEGCTRLYTYLVTKPLGDDILDAMGEHLRMNVRVHALCDNYDRIGSINLALVPKGQTSYQVKYDDTDPLRVEIARFITPFMNKNKEPMTCPYSYDLDYLAYALRDADLRDKYDFWLELMIFGVPYAANQQIAGCAGCNDVFQGSVDFVTDDIPAQTVSDDVFVPITIRTADWRADRGMNNYNAACTDELGKTIKTWTYTVPEDCADGRLVLVMSNHGAGNNGEEYVRRKHYVYSDGEQVKIFKPGCTSCEPFRQYNTQANGIYGNKPMSDLQWQSFSNWCPGDVIDNRLIDLGAIAAGEHTVTIEVPDAKFAGQDGYFPVSLFFQGVTSGMLPGAAVEAVEADDYTTAVTVEGGMLRITAPDPIDTVDVYTIGGQLVVSMPCASTCAALNVSRYDAGVYLVVVTTSSAAEAHKIAL